MQNYDLTDYPKVYKLKYWGQFTYDERDTNNEILENRNKFIKDYNINVKSKSQHFHTHHALSSSTKLYSHLDHIECYLENGTKNIIIITSLCNINSINYLKSNGWDEIYPLYSSGAKTFIKIFKPRNIYEQLNPKKK